MVTVVLLDKTPRLVFAHKSFRRQAETGGMCSAADKSGHLTQHPSDDRPCSASSTACNATVGREKPRVMCMTANSIVDYSDHEVMCG